MAWKNIIVSFFLHQRSAHLMLSHFFFRICNNLVTNQIVLIKDQHEIINKQRDWFDFQIIKKTSPKSTIKMLILSLFFVDEQVQRCKKFESLILKIVSKSQYLTDHKKGLTFTYVYLQSMIFYVLCIVTWSIKVVE